VNLDLQNSVNDIWYRLGFLSLVEMQAAGAWVTETELFTFLDEAAKRLAYEAGLFVTVDSSIPIVAGNPVLQLPLTHVYTLLAAVLTLSGAIAGTGAEWGTVPWGTVPWGGNTPFTLGTVVSYALLRLTSARDLWALDNVWPTTTGNPKRASLDANAVGSLTLYPIPVAAGILFQVCQEFPNVSAAASQIPLPTVMQDYFSDSAICQAKRKESEMADNALADHMEQRCKMYEAVFEQYFGGGQ
jgi:hypothetical protein